MNSRTFSFRPLADVPPTLDRLPAEILLEVANYLTSRADVLQLSQVSSSVYAKVVPALYANVELHGPEQCERTLAMLQRCPGVARHIRTLSVHPEDGAAVAYRPEQLRAWDSAGVVSREVMKVARHLDALARFDWVGEDMLPDDRMWAELRTRCPRLRHVGTTFGCFLPRPTSSLFQFVDLVGFSLTLKDGFYAHSLHLPSRGVSDANKGQHIIDLADPESESEPVFTRLWDMLTLRCPDLESLRIIGNSSEPGDPTRLYSAEWPKLKHLGLSALVWNTNPSGQQPAVPDLIAFLEGHPGIESLHLLGRPSTNQVDLTRLAPDALPTLKEFSGSFSLLRMLVDRAPQADPNAPAGNAPQQAPQNPLPNPNQPLPPVVTPLSKTLERICFPHAMHLRDLTPLAISRVLVGLHALTSIKATFAIQGGYDSNGIFRTIVASCPQLLDLDITCTCRPSFLLDAFANALRGLSRLRTLSLALVRMPGEEPMHVGAARIALANPRLRRFALAFIPVHAGPDAPLPAPPLERGEFELACDAHGIPVALAVTQRACAALWPWQRAAGVGPGAGLAEWLAAAAGALGVEGPLLLLEHNAGGLGGLRLGLAGAAVGGAVAMGTAAAVGGRHAGPKERAMSVRRWVHDLRPSGHPDVRPKGVGELLLERSPAGEEARLMTFCLCLFVLTVWALASKAMR